MNADSSRSHSPVPTYTSTLAQIRATEDLAKRQEALEAKAAELFRREQELQALYQTNEYAHRETTRPISSYCVKGIKIIALIIVFPVIQLGTGFIFTVRFGGLAAKYTYQKLSARDVPKACAAILAGVATIPGGIGGFGFGILICSFLAEHRLIKTVLNDKSLYKEISKIISIATDW